MSKRVLRCFGAAPMLPSLLLISGCGGENPSQVVFADDIGEKPTDGSAEAPEPAVESMSPSPEAEPSATTGAADPSQALPAAPTPTMGDEVETAASGSTSASSPDPTPSAPVVALEDSIAWTWEECGRIPSYSLNASYPTPVFSPSGGELFTVQYGEIVEVPLPLDAEPRLPWPASEAAPVAALAVSQDGALLAAVGARRFELWEREGKTVVASFPIPAECSLGRVVLSADAELAFVGSDPGCVLRVVDGELLGTLQDAGSIAFADGDVLATSCDAKACALIRYATDGSELSRQALDAGPDVSFSADFTGDLVALAPRGDAVVAMGEFGETGDAAIAAWETDGTLRWLDVRPRTESFFRGVPAFSPDGTLVMAADAVWEVGGGDVVVRRERGPSAQVYGTSYLSPDGLSYTTPEPELAAVESGGTLAVFRPHFATDPIYDLDISADGSLLATNSQDTIGWRVAEDFSESRPVWSTSAEGAYAVSVSPDARYATVSGDVRVLLDARSGVNLLVEGAEAIASSNFDELCFSTDFAFTPDSRYVVGKHYTSLLTVYDLEGAQYVGSVETGGCGQGVAFSFDGARLFTPEKQYSFPDLAASSLPGLSGERAFGYDTVEVSKDAALLLRTSCDGACDSSLIQLASSEVLDPPGIRALTARHPRFSSEGHWIVSGGTLLYWPTGTVVEYDRRVTEALFAPNGDIIAGLDDSTLVRYCRAGGK